MKDVLIRFFLFTASLLVCLVLAELVARQGLSHITRRGVSSLSGSLEADPSLLIEFTRRGRRFVPNADAIIHNHFVSGADVDIRTNSFGLRNAEFETLPKSGTERILFVGDSIVAQDYLASEKTSARMLEAYLAKHSLRPVEVVNAGMSNFGLEEELQLVEDIIDKVNPTTILLSFYLNDSRPAWGFSGELGERRGWIRKHSIIVETLIRELEARNWLADSKIERFSWIKLADQGQWKTSVEALRSMAMTAPYDWGSAWKDDSWPSVEEKMRVLKELAQSRNAKFIVVIMPVSYQVEAQYLDDLPQQKARQLLEQLKIPSFSVLDVFRNHNQEQLFFDWCHPNERGNAVMVPAIGDFVLAQLSQNKGG